MFKAELVELNLPLVGNLALFNEWMNQFFYIMVDRYKQFKWTIKFNPLVFVQYMQIATWHGGHTIMVWFSALTPLSTLFWINTLFEQVPLFQSAYPQVTLMLSISIRITHKHYPYNLLPLEWVIPASKISWKNCIIYGYWLVCWCTWNFS